ncbi:ER membrane protein complex subunit 6 [Diplogelasinospora grovesii]|uniref:ER membrane protein complex subunit 6 n=1 Tax=Diplogelasinospora grovesii TaxID=303347 RepID=A0AAN6N3I2_9PEZI|nr:ER membrane protein complex subunit 6 [Diplogelasinospora grovesii]
MPQSAELEIQISPIVQESLVHNSKTLYNLQSLTASLFGVAAGILGLESYNGFLFYIICSLLTTTLFYILRVAAPSSTTSKSSGIFDTSRYFKSSSSINFEFWTGGLMNGLAGFILTWTLFYGLVRA